MSDLRPRTRFSDRLTSRRGAWLSLGAVLVGILVLFGLFGQAEAPEGIDPAPADSESAQVDDLLATFPDADTSSVLVVVTREDGAQLTEADAAALADLTPALDGDGTPAPPVISDDGEAAVIVAPLMVGESNGETADDLKVLRADLADVTPDGLEVQVTGGPAFGADIAGAFDGADFTLLLVTILIVAVLLIITYRSPVLWLIPLVVVAIADQLAGKVAAALGQAFDLQFDAGIIRGRVFGAGTNYPLLLISRYREELRRDDDHRHALSAAWRATAPAILASNVTVVLALLTLVFAVIPGTRGLGVSAAAGLLVALAAVLFALPPLLAVCGRGIFWPFIPRPGELERGPGLWHRMAAGVMRAPGRSLMAGLALLAIMASGLIGTTVGLDQLEKFHVPSESAAGLEVLSEHFPAGEAQPILIVANTEQADEVIAAVEDVDGILRAHPTAETDDGTLTTIMATGEYAPGSDDSLAQIAELRDAVHAVPGADALVGGPTATEVDARAGNAHDLWLIAPLVLAVSFAVLVLLLRSLVAPVVLLALNIASALAAIGAGAWLSRMLFEQHALDLQVPLLSFLFLVALGIDYTIFLVHRARTEARTHGTRAGMVRAVAHTGGVITSAGIVLAGVFAALGVLPLVTLGQLGLIVGVGVIVDTLVVRTVIVPAVFGLLGDRIWWPARPPRADDAQADVTGDASPDAQPESAGMEPATTRG